MTDGIKIPPRIECLKLLYEKYGMKWVQSTDIYNLTKIGNHRYALKDHKELETIFGYDEPVNRDESEVEKNKGFAQTKFYRITAEGLIALNKFYGIRDENYKFATKALLTRRIKSR